MRRLPALLFVLALQSACYMHTVEIRPWRDEPYASDTQVHFFWGITGVTTPAPVCQRGLERAVFYMPWWGFIVAPITLGIVVPTTVDYVCESRSQYDNAPPRGEKYTGPGGQTVVVPQNGPPVGPGPGPVGPGPGQGPGYYDTPPPPPPPGGY